MHFCKANDGCCGDAFHLKRLTDKEQKIHDELNSVFSQLSSTSERFVDPQPVLDRAEELKAIEDRMEKLKVLMKKMDDGT